MQSVNNHCDAALGTVMVIFIQNVLGRIFQSI